MNLKLKLIELFQDDMRENNAQLKVLLELYPLDTT